MATAQCMLHKPSSAEQLCHCSLLSSASVLRQDTRRTEAEDSRVALQRAADVAHCSTMKATLRIAHELMRHMLCSSPDRGTSQSIMSAACSSGDWQTASQCGALLPHCGLHGKALLCRGCMEALQPCAVSVRTARSQSTNPGCLTDEQHTCHRQADKLHQSRHGRTTQPWFSSAQHAANEFPVQLRCMPSEGTYQAKRSMGAHI